MPAIAPTMPKSCSQTGGVPAGVIRYGRSSCTLKPMCSSIGRLSDSVTGAPLRSSLNRSAPGAASAGRYSDSASGDDASSGAIIAMSATAVRTG